MNTPPVRRYLIAAGKSLGRLPAARL